MTFANCSFCGGEIIVRQIKAEFWWGEELNIFLDVPAGVCQRCGEQYFDGEVYDTMAQQATSREGIQRKIQVPVRQFAAVA
jgi:YgiT-type zinc finger domain-containing protein